MTLRSFLAHIHWAGGRVLSISYLFIPLAKVMEVWKKIDVRWLLRWFLTLKVLTLYAMRANSFHLIQIDTASVDQSTWVTPTKKGPSWSICVKGLQPKHLWWVSWRYTRGGNSGCYNHWGIKLLRLLVKVYLVEQQLDFNFDCGPALYQPRCNFASSRDQVNPDPIHCVLWK